MKKVLAAAVAIMLVFGLAGTACAEDKMGYVDLRRAFYEYEQTKQFEESLNELTEQRQEKRTQMINRITKLRDEAEMLKGEAQSKKQAEIDRKLAELQTYDRETRQELLNKKNEMFRNVIDDIQKVVNEIGTKGGYTYILDSRNIMFADEQFDLTDQVIKQLNQ
ncbi:MAG: hypothetical protein GF408_07785 [Candidatus Omnitrophica bacterium]|nr:hypothetical protein [Candidatus Omnitrophota bacterium]